MTIGRLSAAKSYVIARIGFALSSFDKLRMDGNDEWAVVGALVADWIPASGFRIKSGMTRAIWSSR